MPTTEIHAHEVIDLIRTTRPGLNRDNAAAAVRQRFGDDARFHACSGGGMTAEQTIEFLLMRGKVYEQDGVLVVRESAVCRH